jgi:hypothetical protein
MRAEFCHFIHLNEYKDYEIPKEVFFKARNFYFAKRRMINDEIMRLEKEGKLNPEELEKLFV